VDKFAKMGLSTVEHALFTLPFRYEDRRRLTRISQLKPDTRDIFFGSVLAAGEKTTSRSHRKLFEVVVGDGSGTVSLKWFHYRKHWIEKQYPVGRRGIFYGEIKRFGSILEIHHPDVEFLSQGQSPEALLQSDPLNFGRILPVYPLTEGLTQKKARKIWKEIVDRFAGLAESPIPEEIRRRQRLLPLSDALRQVHFPHSDSSLKKLEERRDSARRTLVFETAGYSAGTRSRFSRGAPLYQAFGQDASVQADGGAAQSAWRDQKGYDGTASDESSSSRRCRQRQDGCGAYGSFGSHRK
jgi:ATP-dependent DNA helicase RecG